MPLRWRDQEIYPPARTIGSSADCDLCYVIKGEGGEANYINIQPLIVHRSLLDFLNRFRSGPINWLVSLEARAVEGVSEIHMFEITWDGQWENGKEISKHLSISGPVKI